MAEHRHSCDAYDAGGPCDCEAGQPDESVPLVQWEVMAIPMRVMVESGLDPTMVPAGWEPFATTVSVQGAHRLWVRRPL